MECVTLNNGVKMPKVFFGCFQIPPEETEKAVAEAIKLGYRGIDTAQGYKNEKGVGDAVKNSGIPREEFFITTKIWITNAGEDKAVKSVVKSMENLQTDYIDLVLVHHPFNDYYGTWRALEKMYKEGKIKAIGVSNFYPDRLIDLIMFNEIVPAVNQVETHVFDQQLEASKIMKKYNVQQQAWSPLGSGLKSLFSNELLIKIADNHKKSVAQIALRYLLQRDIVVLPRSVNPDRMKENTQVFDFELTKEEMNEIQTLDQGKSLFFDHRTPEALDRMAKLIKERQI